MKSLSISSKLVMLLMAIGLFTACDSQLQSVFKASLTPQAQHATDVLPPDAQMVAMLNTQDLKSNEYTNVFGPNNLLDEAPEEAIAHFNDFIAATGFDPEKDLKEVYLAAGPLDGETKNVALVAYGTIDAEQLQAYVEREAGDELDSYTYSGTTIFTKSGEKTPALSFVNDDMILAANSADHLEAMLDRLEGDGDALGDNSKMMELITQAAAGQSAWFVARKPDIAPPTGDMPSNDLAQNAIQIFKAVDYVVGALNIESDGLDGQVFVYPNDSVSADDLASLMNGVIAAAKANPELQEKDLEVLDDIRARAQDNHVHLNLYVENSLIAKVKG